MIVTISRAYGAGGNAVARRAAALLGYRFVDEELDEVVAIRLGTGIDEATGGTERPRGFGERVLGELSGGGVPELAVPASYDPLAVEQRRAIEGAVREIAAGGDAVIVGRAAGAILAGLAELVRVFVHAPLPWRVARISASLRCDEQRARREIARVDEARRTYAREAYRVSWGDPNSYDLVVNTSRFGVEGAAEVIAAAVRAATR